jgi:hypothetical protein
MFPHSALLSPHVALASLAHVWAFSPVDVLARASAPWQEAYNNSRVLPTAVTAVHLLALLFSGGLAVAADRATLRALRGPDDARRREQIVELHDVHRPVLIAMGVLFASGVLLAAADVETFFASPVFWVKLALVALLLINGVVLYRTEGALRRADAGPGEPPAALWRRLRASSWASLALWGATTLAGAVLVGAA